MADVIVVEFAEVNSRCAELRRNGDSVKAARRSDGLWELTVTPGAGKPMSKAKAKTGRFNPSFPASSGEIWFGSKEEAEAARVAHIKKYGGVARVIGCRLEFSC